MKLALFFFLLGAVAGGWGMHYYDQRVAEEEQRRSSLAGRTAALADQAKNAAVEMKDSISQKLEAWKLTPDDIKADLAKTGSVIRSRARAAGDRIDDARIVAVVKAKYVLASELSARAIDVACQDGEVTLNGTADTPAAVGKAIAIALDTSGVHHVVSHLVVKTDGTL
jgi:osmotically-inducible protein OsmY